MATDVDVQYFSHLNGLTLGNNWGDLIRLLDNTLVTGIDFTQITAASIGAQGDVHITLYAAHKAMLFQVVELSGFTPASLNQKYRIKGVPNTTQLILKPKLDIAERAITTTGAGKLASLGYDIIFRDLNDVKRVYRAKNPTAQHPFIRVDESLTSPDGVTGIYGSSYAKYGMVGLLERMDHIDDYENPDVLQLPFDPANPSKNWKITGTGTGAARGWSRWYFGTNNEPYSGSSGTSGGSSGARKFTLFGNVDCFYLNRSTTPNSQYKYISGAGLFNESIDSSVIPSWFLMTYMSLANAGQSINPVDIQGGEPFSWNPNTGSFFTLTYNPTSRLSQHTASTPITPDFSTGMSALYSGSELAAVEIPFFDAAKRLRGSLKHIFYCGDKHNINKTETTPILSDNSMFVYDSLDLAGNYGGVYFYVGVLE
ncbi:hypothetical protein E0H89_11280 [Acinetobacter sp. ANC 3781]|uniref:hypothetical protein n=1 Tax=Acinetobacter sp. ANC 3781 TaxID=2529835 RepID=UPI0010402029|nr:hypothetical protein [Acinetobacter sp. ANC 3781]TCB75519.1 hypothetical protein E0H89_11280 [Acinetobacter sp. ANC 3781]